MDDRIVVITGGNSGVGLETAVGVAGLGARVVMGCRNQAKADAAVSEINRMLENKTLLNNVALTMPLKEIVAAHEAVEQGKAFGNVVVSMT